MPKPTGRKGRRRAFLRGAAAAVALMGLGAMGCGSAHSPRTIQVPEGRAITFLTVNGEGGGFMHDLVDMRGEMRQLGRVLEALRLRFIGHQRLYGEPAFEGLTNDRMGMLLSAVGYAEAFESETRALMLGSEPAREEMERTYSRFGFFHGLLVQQVGFIFSNSRGSAVNPYLVLEQMGICATEFGRYGRMR